MKNKYGEPWRVVAPTPDEAWIRKYNNKTVTDNRAGEEQAPGYDEQVRIVACVNAMAGIENPAEFMKYANLYVMEENNRIIVGPAVAYMSKGDKIPVKPLTAEESKRWFDSLSKEEQESLMPDK